MACNSAETVTSNTPDDFLSHDINLDRVEGYPDPHELQGKEVCSLEADPAGQMAQDCHISTCDEPSESQSDPLGGSSDNRPDNCKSDISSQNDQVQPQCDQNCTVMYRYMKMSIVTIYKVHGLFSCRLTEWM